MSSKIKIVIADDMKPILLYLEKLISSVPEFEIVGKAQNGNELVDLVVKNEPQIVITDVEMPECNGIQAIERLNELKIKTKYILVTGSNDCIMTCKASKMGILGIIKKPITDDDKFIKKLKNVMDSKTEENIQSHSKTVQKELMKKQFEKKKKENIMKKIINKILKSK